MLEYHLYKLKFILSRNGLSVVTCTYSVTTTYIIFPLLLFLHLQVLEQKWKQDAMLQLGVVPTSLHAYLFSLFY